MAQTGEIRCAMDHILEAERKGEINHDNVLYIVENINVAGLNIILDSSLLFYLANTNSLVLCSVHSSCPQFTPRYPLFLKRKQSICYAWLYINEFPGHTHLQSSYLTGLNVSLHHKLRRD